MLNETVSYKFLFNKIISDPDCPHKFKNNTMNCVPYSAYERFDPMVMGNPQLQQMITDLINLPAFAGARTDKAFDELLSGNKSNTTSSIYSSTTTKKEIEVNAVTLKAALTKVLGKTYQEEVYS